MSGRREWVDRWAAPLVLLVITVVLTVVFLVAGFGPDDATDAASVARIPVPGSEDVELAARPYLFSYGLFNAPQDVELRVPPLSIDIEPLAAAADPDFREDHAATSDRLADGTTVRRVAFVTPRTAGEYHVEVSSPNGNDGELLIGERIEHRTGAAIRRGALVLVGGLVVTALVAVGQRKRRRA